MRGAVLQASDMPHQAPPSTLFQDRHCMLFDADAVNNKPHTQTIQTPEPPPPTWQTTLTPRVQRHTKTKLRLQLSNLNSSTLGAAYADRTIPQHINSDTKPGDTTCTHNPALNQQCPRCMHTICCLQQGGRQGGREPRLSTTRTHRVQAAPDTALVTHLLPRPPSNCHILHTHQGGECVPCNSTQQYPLGTCTPATASCQHVKKTRLS